MRLPSTSAPNPSAKGRLALPVSGRRCPARQGPSLPRWSEQAGRSRLTAAGLVVELVELAAVVLFVIVVAWAVAWVL
jgi:hypothetical protein